MESRIAGAQSQPTERQSAISTDETAALATSPSVNFFCLKAHSTQTHSVQNDLSS